MKFPALSAEDVLANVEARWDLTGPLPVPRGEWLACPVCRAGQPQPRHWNFHRHGTTHPWRCDVSWKCISCSAVWIHGVAVPQSMYVAAVPHNRAQRIIQWREARQILEEAQWPTT